LTLALSPSPGQVVTYQFGSIEPFGASFKVTPETTETEVNVRKCFRINGTDRDLITPQSVFPSLENFKVSSKHGPPGCGMRWGRGQRTSMGTGCWMATSKHGPSGREMGQGTGFWLATSKHGPPGREMGQGRGQGTSMDTGCWMATSKHGPPGYGMGQGRGEGTSTDTGCWTAASLRGQAAGSGQIQGWMRPWVMQVEGLHPAWHDAGQGAMAAGCPSPAGARCRGAVPAPAWHGGPRRVRWSQRLREERFRGQRCAVWQNVSYWGRKKNVYTLRVGSSARGPVPLHYEVRGFNSLLGSHYDKYEIDYSSFSHRFPPSVFRLPEGECPRPPRSPARCRCCHPNAAPLPPL